ncbi:hypothetical protein [Kutzneria sp. NPDC052558]|uniref:hypothetical protein n=1 Tax=Kutzneria sp. NPDC052558 TaxID=3364121 RepID=UPI0037C776AA
MRFTGLRPLTGQSQTEVVLAELGPGDLCNAEVFRLEPELPLAVDPGHGYALLTDLLSWPGGCTAATTLMTMDLHTAEVRATAR